ncbi:YkoP family protein [Gracilibacillus sp. HCP3S3_G5_1]|uniref:YkoP family protein n=1 Tax=unclassified Gracilibacillus TaxID=2625209 RepID=UPI003F8BDBA4
MKIKLYVLTLWSVIDPIYFMFTRLTYIDDLKDSDRNIFRVRLTRYKGKESILSDGTVIRKNDVLIKIHLHNTRLMKRVKSINSDVRKAMVIHKSVEKSLPQLAEYINNHANFHEIKGIIGITMLNRGSSKLGFDAVEINNRFYRYFKCIALLPIYWLSVTSISIHNLKKHTPCYLFMSKEKLLEKYFHQS